MIKVDNISMYYGTVCAVDNVSFEAKKGEILALLGPNGAGKSTTMKILTTFILPTSGTASVEGYDVVKDPLSVRGKIGYLPETAPLYMDMMVSDYLFFAGNSRGLNKSLLKKRISWIVEACGLKLVYKKDISELSRGYKQRVGLAQALIHDPDVLILDEPTSGLDPLQIIGIRELIKELGKEKTIIYSTHILQEVVAVSDRVVIINEGKVIANGSVDELRKQASEQNRSVLVVKAGRKEVEETLENIANVNYFNFLKEEKGLQHFEIFNAHGRQVWQELDEAIKEKGWVLRSYYDDVIPFEEAFITITRKARKGEVI